MSRERALVAFSDIDTRALYGSQRSLYELYRHWHREGRYELLFLHTVDGELDRALRELGIRTERIPAGGLLRSYGHHSVRLSGADWLRMTYETAAFERALVRVLRSRGVDLLHCNDSRTALLCLPAARWLRCPLVAHIREERSLNRLDAVLHRGAPHRIWVSEATREWYARKGRARRPALRDLGDRVIHNGRPRPEATSSTREELRHELRLPPDARLVLVLASLDPRKDHETLIDSAAIACGRRSDLWYLCAGRDPSAGGQRKRMLRERIRSAGLGRRVRLLGHRSDVSRLLRGVDLLVHPSREEALGGAMIEALAYGLPCVATDAGGTREVVRDGEHGFLVSRGDAAALADRTLQLLDDDALRERFAHAAQAHFERHFTIERCAEATGAYFDEILRSRSGRGRRARA